jgi:hypothetical protein
VYIPNCLSRWLGSAALISGLAAITSLAPSPAAIAGTATYTDSSCTSFVISGAAPNQTITCVGGGAAKPVCVPTANPAAPVAGQSTTISANCSNQPLANGYVWTGGACAGLTGPTCAVRKSTAQTIAYSVSGSNAAGTGAAAQINVTWH